MYTFRQIASSSVCGAYRQFEQYQLISEIFLRWYTLCLGVSLHKRCWAAKWSRNRIRSQHIRGVHMEAVNLESFKCGDAPFVLMGGCQDWFSSNLLELHTGKAPISLNYAEDEYSLCAWFESAQPDLVLLHDQMGIFWNGMLEQASRLCESKGEGSSTAIAVVTRDPSLEDLMNALYHGALDYLYLGPRLNLSREISRLLTKAELGSTRQWNPEGIKSLGFLRSLGLSKYEIDLLVEYARDFPRLKELARRLKKSEIYLRKCFSRIYDKLGDLLAIDNQAQLARLLTICCACG